jgi:hypothetical protein
MSQYRHERHFTVDEANALLPRISLLLLKLSDALRLLEGQRREAVETLRLARTNGKGGAHHGEDGLELVKEIVGEIEGFGCVVKGFEEPLIDFPALRDGEEVYLCWKLGEPEVGAWHPLDSGFAGRQRL